MPDKRRRHIEKMMKEFKAKDYAEMEEETLEMLGTLTKEDLEFIRKIPKTKKQDTSR